MRLKKVGSLPISTVGYITVVTQLSGDVWQCTTFQKKEAGQSEGVSQCHFFGSVYQDLSWQVQTGLKVIF